MNIFTLVCTIGALDGIVCTSGTVSAHLLKNISGVHNTCSHCALCALCALCAHCAHHVHTETTRCSAPLLRNKAESYCSLYVLAMHAASTRELTRETLKNTDLVEGGHSVGVRMVCTLCAQHVHTENTRCSASLLRNQAESYCFLYVLAMYAASTRELTRETLKNAVLVEGSRSAGVRTECTECTVCTVCTWSALGVHSPVR